MILLKLHAMLLVVEILVVVIAFEQLANVGFAGRDGLSATLQAGSKLGRFRLHDISMERWRLLPLAIS